MPELHDPALPTVENLLALAQMYLVVREAELVLTPEQRDMYLDVYTRLGIDPLPEIADNTPITWHPGGALHDQMAETLNEIDAYMPLPLSAVMIVAGLYHELKQVGQSCKFHATEQFVQQWEQHREVWLREGKDPPCEGFVVGHEIASDYFIELVDLVSHAIMRRIMHGWSKYVAEKCVPRHVAVMRRRERKQEVKMRTIYRGARRRTR